MLPTTSGIYTITNLLDGKVYVGLALNLRARAPSHFRTLKLNIHMNEHLQRAYNKYGIDNFKFEILQECDEYLLRALEHYWTNLLNSRDRNFGYNIAFTNPNGKVKHSKETIDKIVAKNKGLKRSEDQKRRKALIYKGLPYEYLPKIPYIRKEFIKERYKLTEEIENKINNLNKLSYHKDKRFREINCFDLEGNLVKTYTTLQEINKELLIPRTTLQRMILTNRLINNLIFKYTIYG